MAVQKGTGPVAFLARQVADKRCRFLALVALIALAMPANTIAAEKGLSTDLTWGISSTDQDRTVAAAQDLGAKWMRLNLTWSDAEPRKGSYSWTRFDGAVSKAHAAGFKILMTIYKSPGWASGSSDPEMPPQNPADYANFARVAAQRYLGKVQAWQVWNEQNYSRFWPSGPNAGQYAQLLKTAYPAIKAVDPTLKVVFGGLSQNDYEYVEAAYDAVPDLGNYFDVMASHPYTWSEAPEKVWIDSNGRVSKGSFAGYREIRQTMLNHGTVKPIWFTEMGWSTTSTGAGVTEEQQRDFLTRAYQCIEQDPYVELGIWYTFRNNYWANDADTWEDRLGLVRTDFSKKPAYDAYKSYTPGAGGCTYQYPRGAAPPPVPPTPPVEPSEPPATPEVPEVPTTETATTVRTTSSTSSSTPQTGTANNTSASSAPTRPVASLVSGVDLHLIRVDGGTARIASGPLSPARLTRVRLAGRVAAAGGRIRLVLERRVGGRWVRRMVFNQKVSPAGTFRTPTSVLGAGEWRVRAAFSGGDGAGSHTLRFRV